MLTMVMTFDLSLSTRRVYAIACVDCNDGRAHAGCSCCRTSFWKMDQGRAVSRAVRGTGRWLDGDKFYVFGGLGPGWIPQGLVYEYDPATKNCSELPMMISPAGTCSSSPSSRQPFSSGESPANNGSFCNSVVFMRAVQLANNTHSSRRIQSMAHLMRSTKAEHGNAISTQ